MPQSLPMLSQNLDFSFSNFFENRPTHKVTYEDDYSSSKNQYLEESKSLPHEKYDVYIKYSASYTIPQYILDTFSHLHS